MMVSLFNRQQINVNERAGLDSPDRNSVNGSDAEGDADDNKSQKSEKFVANSGDANKDQYINQIQIETTEEPGFLDTSRTNDFDGSFLKVAEFESPRQIPNAQKDSDEEEQYEYVHDLQTNSPSKL
jgi:hypothetical protein